VNRRELEDLVRVQLSLVAEPGPLMGAVFAKIIEAAGEYAAAPIAVSDDEVILPQAALTRIQDIRAGLASLISAPQAKEVT
jgi:hypothetical protein